MQPVSFNTGTTTTRKNILVSSTIDQEVAYLIAFKAAKIARLTESSSYADAYENVRTSIMSAEIQELASMQIDMNKPSSHSENAVQAVAASSTSR